MKKNNNIPKPLPGFEIVMGEENGGEREIHIEANIDVDLKFFYYDKNGKELGNHDVSRDPKTFPEYDWDTIKITRI